MTRSLATAVLALCVVLALACAPQAPAELAEKGFDGSIIRFNTLYLSSRGGLAQPQTMVIKDEAGWQQLQSRLPSRRIPPQPLPPVEFQTLDVIAVFLGERPSGGYAIMVKQVLRKGEKVVVVVEESIPGEGCMRTMAFTRPFHLVAVPKLKLPVEFIHRRRIKPCP